MMLHDDKQVLVLQNFLLSFFWSQSSKKQYSDKEIKSLKLYAFNPNIFEISYDFEITLLRTSASSFNIMTVQSVFQEFYIYTFYI